MKKHYKNAVKKVLCFALSLGMAFGPMTGTALAAKKEAGKDTEDAVQLTCVTKPLELPETDKSLELHICLAEEDGKIKQKIYKEDVTLGGVFQDMIVSDVKNDKETILLDLIGVPEFSGKKDGKTLQGTMEFPGELFGSEKAVSAAIDVTAKEGGEEAAAPAFQAFLDGLRDAKDKMEMCIVLLPTVGEFAEGFSEESIIFGGGLQNAEIMSFKEDGDGCYEFYASVPKADMEEGEEGYSCLGGIALAENSMISPAGEPYEKRLGTVRKFSSDAVGRDLTENDISEIKKVVGGFGNTTAGTITGIISGGASAFSAAYTMLGWCGVVPNDTSRHAEIMEALQDIQETVHEIDSKCDYMIDVLDEHTRMLIEMGVKMDEQYLGTFNSDFDAMVETMDTFEELLSYRRPQKEIEKIVNRLSEEYNTPQDASVGRDLDEEMIIEADESYLEYSPEEAAEPVEDTIAFDDLMIAEENQPAEEEIAAEEETSEPEEEPAGEETVEEEPAEETDRILDAEETKEFLMDLDLEIAKIDLSGSGTIGDYLHDIKTAYTSLSKRFNVNDSSNPINAYINIHQGTDNFATISLNEKELYKQYCQYQLTRALTILQTYDSPVAYQTKRANFDASLDKWPATDKGATDSSGNPYCYLMEGYVRLATADEMTAFWKPLHSSSGKTVQVKSSSGKDVRMQDFLRRMNGRTLEEELNRAGITNYKQVREEYFPEHNKKNPDPKYNKYFGGLTFYMERWGHSKGYKTYTYTPRIYDGMSTGEGYLGEDDDYCIVAPDWMRWSDRGLYECPAEILYYSDWSKTVRNKLPLTTLVKA